MKLILSMTLGLILFQNVFATEYQLGAVLGGPTGISGKVSVDKLHSVDVVLAYSFAHDFGLEFHADYLVDKAHTFSTNTDSPLYLYYGIGGRVVSITKGKHSDSLAFGPRAPVGVTYQLIEPRIEFFGELALAFDFVPEANLDLEGGIGGRYCF